MIKEGYDHFEITRQEPKVDFCEKHYVFDAVRAPNATKDPVFEAAAKCPTYVIPDEIADAVRDKQQQDEAEVAKLVAKGTPVAKLNTGIDGGMNEVFAARVPGGSTGLSEGGEGQGLALAGFARLPGTVPSTVNPPHAPGAANTDEPVVAAAPAASAPSTRVASAVPATPAAASSSDGFFSNLARKIGLGGATAGDSTASAPPAPAPAKPKLTEAKASIPKAAKPAEAKQAANRPPLKPSVSDTPADQSAAPTQDAQVAGSAPIMQANSFENRFSASAVK
jgi:hypothetical protein